MAWGLGLGVCGDLPASRSRGPGSCGLGLPPLWLPLHTEPGPWKAFSETLGKEGKKGRNTGNLFKHHDVSIQGRITGPSL